LLLFTDMCLVLGPRYYFLDLFLTPLVVTPFDLFKPGSYYSHFFGPRTMPKSVSYID